MKAVTYIDGLPRLQYVVVTTDVYDEYILISAGGISAGTALTLPNYGSYYGAELNIFLNGSKQEVGIDYNIVGSTPPYTQITFTYDLMADDLVVFRKEMPSPVGVYEQAVDVGSTITAGTAVTLPSAATYSGTELSIYLNGSRLENLYDYTYVGVVPRTQVSFTFDLYSGDRVVFRKEHD